MLEDDAMAEFERERLGCDPCTEVTHVGAGGVATKYLVSDKALLTIEGDEIEIGMVRSAELPMDGQKRFQAMIVVGAPGREKISQLHEFPPLMVANFVDGELVGVGPLVTVGAAYLLGEYSSQADARLALRRLGVRIEDSRPADH
jgi:hypothetical protein